MLISVQQLLDQLPVELPLEVSRKLIGNLSSDETRKQFRKLLSLSKEAREITMRNSSVLPVQELMSQHQELAKIAEEVSYLGVGNNTSSEGDAILQQAQKSWNTGNQFLRQDCASVSTSDSQTY